jgi:hypothetical protein
MLHHISPLVATGASSTKKKQMAVHFLENAYKGKVKTVLVNAIKSGAEVSSTHS